MNIYYSSDSSIKIKFFITVPLTLLWLDMFFLLQNAAQFQWFNAPERPESIYEIPCKVSGETYHLHEHPLRQLDAHPPPHPNPPRVPPPRRQDEQAGITDICTYIYFFLWMSGIPTLCNDISKNCKTIASSMSCYFFFNNSCVTLASLKNSCFGVGNISTNR